MKMIDETRLLDAVNAYFAEHRVMGARAFQWIFNHIAAVEAVPAEPLAEFLSRYGDAPGYHDQSMRAAKKAWLAFLNDMADDWMEAENEGKVRDPDEAAEPQ